MCECDHAVQLTEIKLTTANFRIASSPSEWSNINHFLKSYCPHLGYQNPADVQVSQKTKIQQKKNQSQCCIGMNIHTLYSFLYVHLSPRLPNNVNIKIFFPSISLSFSFSFLLLSVFLHTCCRSRNLFRPRILSLPFPYHYNKGQLSAQRRTKWIAQGKLSSASCAE